MCCRLSWNIIRALKNLSKNIFYFTVLIFKGPYFNYALELVLFLDLVDSPKHDIKPFHLCKRELVFFFLEEEVSHPSSSASWHFLPAPPPQALRVLTS